MKANILHNVLEKAVIAGTVILSGVLIPLQAGNDNNPKKNVNTKIEAAKDAHTEGKEPAVEITAKQKALLGIHLTKAEVGNLENLLTLPGEIQLNKDRTANIMPKMPGFVTSVSVSEGDMVKRGQVLAQITSHKLGEYYSAHNMAVEQEKIAKAELEMAEKLFAQKSMSQKDYLRYRKDYADAVVEMERAETMLKSLNLNGDHKEHDIAGQTESKKVCTLYEIKAPWDGIVLKKDITVGENFAEDNTKVVFVVSDMSYPWLDLRADESEITHLSKDMQVSIKISNNTDVYKGKIIYVAPVIDESTRTGLVRVAIDNHDKNVRPGSFATGVVKVYDKGESVIVPSAAIQLVAGETVVFVPDSDGYSPRDVKVGKSENGFTQVIAGLNAGEEYVSQGGFGLKAILMTSGMTGDGHGH